MCHEQTAAYGLNFTHSINENTKFRSCERSLGKTNGNIGTMKFMEPRRAVAVTTDDDATATAPRIVNGLTVRPREKVNLWRYGILFLPDFALLLIIAGLGMRRLLRYLDANRPKES
jgi:hypothetical protein